MMFAVSGCFPARAAGLSWTVTSQTARYRRKESGCEDHPWIVPGLGADLLANMLIPAKDRLPLPASSDRLS
jgi:hypothetical protein